MIRFTLPLLLLPFMAQAETRVSVSGDVRCITSDGLPDHATGHFPRKGNPHAMSKQRINFCVDATPQYGGQAKQVSTIGIARNGVIIRPGTADWYDPNSPRKHSRNPGSGWRLDGMGASEQLGLDQNNAHVDHRGIYHYHGIAGPLVETEQSFIGWAADGFEIHYVGDKVSSSYRLKPGNRKTAPGGVHDGTYVQDWAYVVWSGSLDECNGAMVNGKYTYFATDSFPFFPHCLNGKNITQFR